MSNESKVGRILDGTETRDAIHVAIAPVVAGMELWPGDHVCLGIDSRAVYGPADNCIGIVDPFLSGHVENGQRFYLFLYPGTVTSLRHHWTHPAFREQELRTEQAYAWLTEFARRDICRGDDRQSWMHLFAEWGQTLAKGETICFGDDDMSRQMNDDSGTKERFFSSIEAITGVCIPREKLEGQYFSCGC